MEDIEGAILAWLIREEDPQAREIITWCERQTSGVTCGEGTCWEDYTVVDIEYLDDQGKARETWYEGEFTEFVRELTDAR